VQTRRPRDQTATARQCDSSVWSVLPGIWHPPAEHHGRWIEEER
jgi:hypothetical protein